MSDFAGMEDLLQDFLQEAGDLLSDVDNKLVDLERSPDDVRLLNDIFRGFHTIKGGAGFLNAGELVKLCHLTENLFDKLRNGEKGLTPALMDTILAATQCVRQMFGEIAQGRQPTAAAAEVTANLQSALAPAADPVAPPPAAVGLPQVKPGGAPAAADSGDQGPDWQALHAVFSGQASASVPAVAGKTETMDVSKEAGEVELSQLQPHFPPEGRRSSDRPGAAASAAPSGRRADERAAARETTIRVDTARLDQVLNLSGEIGLTKNRLTSLRADILAGRTDSETLQALDQAVSQLDLLVSDLQNSVMKTRMQPIGRLFQKYPRIARDLARQLGKDVELALIGEETEVDKKRPRSTRR